MSLFEGVLNDRVGTCEMSLDFKRLTDDRRLNLEVLEEVTMALRGCSGASFELDCGTALEATGVRMTPPAGSPGKKMMTTNKFAAGRADGTGAPGPFNV